MLMLPRFTFGIGDRFGQEGEAQLRALLAAGEDGIKISPVWNKSHREHSIVGSLPGDVRAEADAATCALGWSDPYFVDADHIGLGSVDAFIEASDFFTLDVADFIGQRAPDADIEAFVQKHAGLTGSLEIAGLDEPLAVTKETIEAAAAKTLLAVKEAGKLYRHIAERKGEGAFVTEVSMDETETPQSPVEMLFILAACADEGIPAQTVAPKFSGRFNKGVNYVGDPEAFAREFAADVAVCRHAVSAFGLPAGLKLSVHSGSDKFGIYGPIREILRATGAGLHLKTAGTTWLEEIVGLAEAGGDGLDIAREIYREAVARFDELAAPYATVIDIDRAALPDPAEVAGWDGPRLAAAVRHDPACPYFDPNVRQLLHVAYKVAAQMGARFSGALAAHAEIIGRHVSENLLDRHIRRVFPAGS